MVIPSNAIISMEKLLIDFPSEPAFKVFHESHLATSARIFMMILTCLQFDEQTRQRRLSKEKNKDYRTTSY